MDFNFSWTMFWSAAAAVVALRLAEGALWAILLLAQRWRGVL